MNIQPGNSKRRKPETPMVSAGGGLEELCSLVARVGQISIFIILVSAVVCGYITLDNKIAASATQIRTVEKEEKEVDLELIRWKNQYARCSSRAYIMGQVRRFRLPLVETRYTQTSQLVVLTAEQAARTPLLPSGYATARTRAGR